ncbi:MAG TPA: SLC13 family permease [Methylomirabilota bacterium]|nr:SLC13 family permease [Methylomirabilota bacterium]
MTLEIGIVLLLLLATFVAMVWEKVSADVVAMAAFCVLLATGVLVPEEAFQVFSNEAVVTVSAMFVLSAALERTGVIGTLGHAFNRWLGHSDWSVLLVMLPVVALLSAFINNTPVVVVFMPIMISLAARRNIKPSKLLIPLSFASIFGGTCTLIGTSTNLIVSSTAEQHGQEPLSMFELGKVGLILAVAGILYLLTIGRRLLPARETLATLLQNSESKQYLTEVVILPRSQLVGRRLADTPLKDAPHSRALEVIREGESVSGPVNDVVLQAGDRVRLSTVLSSVREITSLEGLQILPRAELGVEFVGALRAAIVECVIGPKSDLIGRTIRDINFRRRFGVLILAVHRHGVNLRENFENVELEYGDTLLIEGTETTLDRLRDGSDLLLLTDAPTHPEPRGRQWIAVGAILFVVLLATFGVLPISALAVIGAVTVVLTGCLKIEEAYRAIDWKIIFLILGMLSIGLALEKTRGVDWIAGGIFHSLGGWGPWVVLGVLCLAASVLTEFISNNAVAILFTPIAIQTAAALDVDARPFIIAVAVGASACFATPIGYQTNTLVYGAGGYLFRDFLKVGIPLNLIYWLIATIVIPFVWPFVP